MTSHAEPPHTETTKRERLDMQEVRIGVQASVHAGNTILAM